MLRCAKNPVTGVPFREVWTPDFTAERVGGQGRPRVRILACGAPLLWGLKSDVPRDAKETEGGQEFALGTQARCLVQESRRCELLSKLPPELVPDVPGTVVSLILDGPKALEGLRVQDDKVWIPFNLQLPAGSRLLFQPELTQEERDRGCYQPTYVVGSFAIRALADGGTGHFNEAKVGHLYRPCAVDSKGALVPCDWRIEDGQLWKLIPRDWVESSARQWPIFDPAYLGHTGTGSDYITLGAPEIADAGAYAATENGTATSVTWYVRGNVQAQCTNGLYSDAAGVPSGLLADGAGIVLSSSKGYHEDTLDAPYSLVSGTVYHPVFTCTAEASPRFYFDAGTKTIRYKSTDTYTHGTMPSTWPSGSSSLANKDICAYITYTPAAGGITGTLDKTLSGIGKSAAGTVAVAGAASKTLSGITKSLAGTVAVTGAASKTLSGITKAMSGAVAVTGAASKTLAGIGLEAEAEDPTMTDGTWFGDPAGGEGTENYLNFCIESNWVDEIVASGDGMVVTLSLADPSYIPTTNRPWAGTVNFIVPYGQTVNLANFLNGAAIGSVWLAGKLIQEAAQTFTSEVKVDIGQLADGNWDLNAGMVLAYPGTAANIGDGGIVTLFGHINVAVCNWDIAAGSTFTVDNAGPVTLNLGSDAGTELLTVTINCTGVVTLGGPLNVKGIGIWAGTLNTNGHTVTVGTGGIVASGGGLILGSSRVNLGGPLTLAGCTADLGTAAIYATANVTIDGTGATSIVAAGADLFANGHTLTLDDLGAITARGWNGPTLTGTTAIESHPGTPSALGLVGAGV